jgi:hypothetical protein
VVLEGVLHWCFGVFALPFRRFDIFPPKKFGRNGMAKRLHGPPLIEPVKLKHNLLYMACNLILRAGILAPL